MGSSDKDVKVVLQRLDLEQALMTKKESEEKRQRSSLGRGVARVPRRGTHLKAIGRSRKGEKTNKGTGDREVGNNPMAHDEQGEQ